MRLIMLLACVILSTIPFDLASQNRNGLGKFMEEVKKSSGNQNRNQRNNSQSNLKQMYQDAKRRAERDNAEKEKASRADQTRKSTESQKTKDKNKNKSVADSQGDVNAKREQDDIALVVNGEGPNKTEATNNALRSAIEQAYGTFVSANTSIVNDELVRDEIATVASGNIKSYREISTTQLPNGNTSVSLSTVVSIGKLVQYAQAHGGSAEFAGQTFMMNMRMQELNKKNEAAAMRNLYEKLKAIQPILYDCSVEVGTPAKSHLYYDSEKLDHEGYCIPFCIQITPTDNLYQWLKEVESTMDVISVSPDERKALNANNINTFNCRFLNKSYIMRNMYGVYSNMECEESLAGCVNILNDWVDHLIIDINSGEHTVTIKINRTAKDILLHGYSSQRPFGKLYTQRDNWADKYCCYVKTSTKHAFLTMNELSINSDIPLDFWWSEDNGLVLCSYFVEDYINNYIPKDKLSSTPYGQRMKLFQPSSDDRWSFYLSFDLFFFNDEVQDLKNFEVRWDY